MQKIWGSIVVIALVFVASRATLWADSYGFSLIPSSGDVTGPAGSTVGWGYSIDNESSSDWLVTTNLQAGTFLDGTPNALFDFLDLAPGQSDAVPFDPVSGVGLYELTWDVSAPLGFTNTGMFELDAEWWSGDPLNGGTFIADATPTLLNYSAAVGSPVTSPVPEPSSRSLITIVLGSLGILVSRKRVPRTALRIRSMANWRK